MFHYSWKLDPRSKRMLFSPNDKVEEAYKTEPAIESSSICQSIAFPIGLVNKIRGGGELIKKYDFQKQLMNLKMLEKALRRFSFLFLIFFTSFNWFQYL